MAKKKKLSRKKLGRIIFITVFSVAIIAVLVAYNDMILITDVSPVKAKDEKFLVEGGTSIELSWNRIDGAASYRIKRSTDKKTWTQQDVGEPGVFADHEVAYTDETVSYIDYSVERGEKYFYKVTALDESGGRTVRRSYLLKTGARTATPVLKEAKSTSPKTVELTWDEVRGAEEYVVMVTAPDGKWERAGTAPAGSTSFKLEDPQSGEFDVKIWIKGNGKESKASDPVHVKLAKAAT